MAKAVSHSLYLKPGGVTLFVHLDAPFGCISLLGIGEKVSCFIEVARNSPLDLRGQSVTLALMLWLV